MPPAPMIPIFMMFSCRACAGSGVVSAVDVDAGAGDECRALACEECDRRADLLGAAVTSEGRSRLLQVRERAVGRIHLRVDRARLDHVDSDALGSEVARPTTGVRGHGGFRGGVVANAGPR